MRVNIQQTEPDAFKAVYALEKYLTQAAITPIHLELIRMRASQLNGCAFCINMHVEEARKHGETDQRLHLVAVWREVGELFTPQEQALLALTEEVTLINQHHVSDAVYDAAAALFDEPYLVQALMAIATINVWNRLAITTHIPVQAQA
jgi:AhpD family alkylhydroperoxidase